jgi:DNA-binding NarL/FixJ family response regulator
MSPPEPRHSIRVFLALAPAITRDAIRHLLDLESDVRVVGDTGEIRDAFNQVADLRPDLLILDSDLLKGSVTQLRAARARLSSSAVLLLNVDSPDRALLSSGIAAALPRTASAADLLVAIRSSTLPDDCSGKGLAIIQEAPTAREIQVLRLVEEGLQNRAIAERLSTRERTVQFHLTNVFAKLSARSRTEAVHLARQQGWLD